MVSSSASELRLAPLPDEHLLLVRDRPLEVPCTEHDQIEGRALPERAVVERVAERPDDGQGLPGQEVVHGQPVGGDATLGEAAAQQAEVFPREQVLDAGVAGRRRLGGDEVEALVGGLEEVPAVLDVDPHAWIVRGDRSGAG